MQNESVKVSVRWSSNKLGQLPNSKSYSTVAKFCEDDEKWPSHAWSVVLDFPSVDIAQQPVLEATARFLVPDAPWERLKTGCEFELYEGFNLTANVIVL